jgi:hypothetical protein
MPTRQDLETVLNLEARKVGSPTQLRFAEALKDQCLSTLAACGFSNQFMGEKIMLCWVRIDSFPFNLYLFSVILVLKLKFKILF